MTIKELFNKTAGNSKLNPVSDGQWSTYEKLCTQKFVKPMSRETFSASAISEEIGRLMKLPFTAKAYPQQLTRFREVCTMLNIKCPSEDIMSAWSNHDVSKRLNMLGKRLPVTEGQIKMLRNLYRFGLIASNDVSAIEPNMSSASELISKHNDEFKKVSEGKLSLGQAERIVQLENELHHVGIDICALSSITFEKASELIEALKKEQDDRREARSYGWDNSGSFNDSADTSRDKKDEIYDTLSFADKDYAQKLVIVRKLQYIVNVDNDVNEEMNETTIDEVIQELYELATVIGESRAAYGVMSVAEEAGEPTVKPTKYINKK